MNQRMSNLARRIAAVLHLEDTALRCVYTAAVLIAVRFAVSFFAGPVWTQTEIAIALIASYAAVAFLMSAIGLTVADHLPRRWWR